MRGFLRQGTAVTIVLGPKLDSTDGNTQETGLTISQADVRLSKNGGAFAQANQSTAASHLEAGYYSKQLNATDTDTLGLLTIAVHESGALAYRGDYMVIEASAYDLMFASVGPVPHQGILDRGQLQAVTSTTSTLRSAAAFGDNTLANCILMVRGSTQGYWQQVQITSNVGSTDVCTHPAWPVTPSGGTYDYYLLGVPGANTSLPFPADVRQWLGTAVPSPHTNGYPVVTVKDGTGTGEIDTTSGGVLVSAMANNSITANAIATGAFTAGKFAAGAFDAVWTVATRTLSTFGSLVANVWDALLSGMSTSGSVGKRIADNLDAAVTSRPSASDVATAVVVAELAALDGMVSGSAQVTIGGVTYDVTRVARDPIATMDVAA